jgi:hypothetical protein
MLSLKEDTHYSCKDLKLSLLPGVGAGVGTGVGAHVAGAAVGLCVGGGSYDTATGAGDGGASPCASYTWPPHMK